MTLFMMSTFVEETSKKRFLKTTIGDLVTEAHKRGGNAVLSTWPPEDLDGPIVVVTATGEAADVLLQFGRKFVQ